MSKKLTDWFEPSVKPELVGVYQTDARTNYQAYQYWDGKKWGGYCHAPEEAYSDRGMRSSHQLARWRGLAEKPGK